MHRRFTVAAAATAALGVAAAGALAAAPASAAVKKNEIRIIGGTVYKPGVMIGDNVRFKKGTRVKSGATVRIVNRGSAEAGPHTVSLLKRSALPLTLRKAEQCFEFQGACGPLAAAHQVDPANPEAPPAVFEYNAGAPGFETMGDEQTAGDSLFIAPGQGGSIEVTARKGTNLFFFCAVHPWMQGKMKVR
jgi:hypothetical protein